MTSADRGTFLRTHYLFRDLEPQVVDKIEALVAERHLGKGEHLFQKGDPGDALYGVISGRMVMCVTGEQGREIILNIIEPGEVFGEIALLDGQPRTADARSMAATSLITIYRRDFIPFLETQPAVSIHFLRLICQRLRQTSEMVEDTILLPLPARLAKRLLAMSQPPDDTDGSSPERRTIRLSQNELGQLTGASREAVNKHLQDWRDSGWIDLGRGRITVVAPAALRELARGGGEH